MKVYFYHTQNLNYIQSEWEKGNFPSHLLYGASQLKNHNIDVIFHRFTCPNKPRWRRNFDVLLKVLFCKKHFDAIYATRNDGLDLLILLHAIGLFRKPIIIWHHQPINIQKCAIKRACAQIYYRGIDQIFMFSGEIMRNSSMSGVVDIGKLQVCPWGADLKFYDKLMSEHYMDGHSGFISTGKELRDMPTLISAFSKTSAHLDIISAPSCGRLDYQGMLSDMNIPDNVSIIINNTMWIPELAEYIWPHACICICCLESNYTVGLTTLVEALAFGLPVIVSKNPNFPFDVEAEGCGISVEYSDVDGWVKAINWIDSHPTESSQMGRNGRELAERIFNIDNCATDVSAILNRYCSEDIE